MDINFITTQKETILPLNAYGAHLWLEIVYSSLPTTFLANFCNRYIIRQAPAQLKHCFPFYWPTEMRVAHVQEKVPRDPYNWSEKITCVSINDLIGDLLRPQCITKPELPPQQLVVYPQSFVHIKLNIAYISSYLPTTEKARCSFARCYLQMLSDNTEGNCCAADTGIVSDVLIERISLH